MNIKELVNFIKWDFRINIGPSLDSIRAVLLLIEVRWEQYIYKNCYIKYHFLKPLWFLTRFFGSVFQLLLCNSNIPGNAQIGIGLRLPHPQNIIVVFTAEIGNFCTIYHNSTIARNGFQEIKYGTPKIGDQVLIGANSIVIGDVSVGSFVLVGAGTVVSNSIPDYSRVTNAKSIVVKRRATDNAVIPGSKDHIRDPYSIWR
jgi:serine acetyltransferase